MPEKLAIIACAVLEDEIAECVRGREHVVKTVILEQKLHDVPDKLRAMLQENITEVENTTDAQAIALGFGLCSRGSEGITTSRCKLVIPRAHDCITLFLGSKERYARYFEKYPGTYWYTTGWIKHCDMPSEERRKKRYEEYCELYDEDNAEYLIEEYEKEWTSKYNRASFVDTGQEGTEEGREFTRKSAEFLGWGFDECTGDLSLLQRMVDGQWDNEDFAVLNPGQTIKFSSESCVFNIVDK